MNRIDIRFAELRKKHETALVAFVVAGDPSLSSSLEILKAICAAGVDILELGIPFSDPTADGPVIQRGAARALKNGAGLAKGIELAAGLRKETETPMILFSYYNPIFAYGAGRFYRDSLAAGVDGVLVVDLPHEESAELTDCWEGDALALIRLIAPTTPGGRMKKIAQDASGFLYLVSKTGVTGSAGLDAESVRRHVAELREVTSLPICVGFGISSPAEAGMLARGVDGVVIGSAFERTIELNLNAPDLAKRVAEQVREYKAALRV